MTHRLYRPHVTGPENQITTPDIVIDRILLVNERDQGYLPVHRLVCDSVLQVFPGEIDITPAYTLVTAGGGVLFGFAALIRQTGESLARADVLVARSAWRFRNLSDHCASVQLGLKAGSSESSIWLDRLAQPDDIMKQRDGDKLALPRGILALCAAPDASVTCRPPADVTVQLADAKLDRSLTNKVGLTSVDSDRWDERPLPRYTVGPVGEVQHYI